MAGQLRSGSPPPTSDSVATEYFAPVALEGWFNGDTPSPSSSLASMAAAASSIPASFLQDPTSTQYFEMPSRWPPQLEHRPQHAPFDTVAESVPALPSSASLEHYCAYLACLGFSLPTLNALLVIQCICFIPLSFRICPFCICQLGLLMESLQSSYAPCRHVALYSWILERPVISSPRLSIALGNNFSSKW